MLVVKSSNEHFAPLLHGSKVPSSELLDSFIRGRQVKLRTPLKYASAIQGAE